MGGQDSKPKQQDFFFLQHISKMTLTNRKTVSYYLIHPRRDPSMDDLLKNMRTYFKVDYFPQIKTLKQEMAFVNKHEIVKVIASSEISQSDVEYLQNEAKIYQIILLGNNNYSTHFSKIVKNVQKPSDLPSVLTHLEQKDSLTIAASNILLVDSDTKLLNKYRLNYQCNTNYNGRNQAKEDFITLAKHLFPTELSQIEKFTKQYNLQLKGEEKRKIVLQWAFKDNFFWKTVSQLTRNTTDPKRLAYIRLALKDLFETISEQFKEKKLYEEIHIVVDVTEEQRQRLQKGKGHFILFTSFIKGYTTEKQANAQLKLRPNAFKFIVVPNRSQLEPSLDFGYVFCKNTQPNVIYNIYNVFRIDEINIKTRRGEILYGVLPECHTRRLTEQNRQKMTNQELDLTRNYDYLEDMLAKVDSQATLLQLFGYHSESLQVYNRKIDSIRKTNDSEQNLGRCIIRKADALRISGDFDAAEKEYQTAFSISDKMHLVSVIHLAELYLQRGQQAKFNKIVDEFTPKLDNLKKHDKQQYFRAYNYIAIRKIHNGQENDFKAAENMLNAIQTELSDLYPYRIEGKPLVHDIYRTKATCQLKLNKHKQALGLLTSTLQYQLACEGKTANVALTQTLIQTVCRSSKSSAVSCNDPDFDISLKESLARMSTLPGEFELSDSRQKSVIGTNLNKSVISISLSQ